MTLASYIADYVNEELDRGNTIDEGIIQFAIEAFKAQTTQEQTSHNMTDRRFYGYFDSIQLAKR